MRVFWTHGYSKAPLSELTAATGMGKGSLYNLFGSKAGLFAAVVEAYQATFSTRIVAALEADDVFVVIDGALAALIAQVGDRATPNGCLLVSGAMDPPGDDPAAAERVRSALRGFESALTARFLRAQADGQLRSDAAPAALGATFAAIIQGVSVTARNAPEDPAALDAIRATAMTMLLSLIHISEPTRPY